MSNGYITLRARSAWGFSELTPLAVKHLATVFAAGMKRSRDFGDGQPEEHVTGSSRIRTPCSRPPANARALCFFLHPSS